MVKRNITLAALLVGLATQAHAAGFVARLAPTMTADIWIAPGGTDSGGTTIGVDCTSAAPCQTPGKAAAMLAANIAVTPAQNYIVGVRGGRYPMTSMLVLNSTHTVSSGFTTTWQAYPGEAPIFSAGVDTAGTWSATALPNGSGASGCVSNALAAYAPMVDGTTTTTADRYVGNMWIDGRRVQATIWPRIGDAPDIIGPLLTPGTATGSFSAQAPLASFSSGSATISIDDLTQIGIVGDTWAIEADTAGFARSQRYWILSKSAATGAGTITVSTTPGGTAKTASATVSNSRVAQRTLPNNLGNRYAVIGDKNVLPVGAGYNSSYGDGKVWLQGPRGSGSSLLPIASATSTQVTLQSSAFASVNTYAGQRLRRWNVFEDLGTSGVVGEMWTNRTTGNIYYTPVSGETCAALNTAGRAIIPGPLETILRISSATADGSSSGAAVGRMAFNGISFQHTNTSVWTGRSDISGSTAGYVGGDNSFVFLTLKPAIDLIGATGVSFASVGATHLGGSGMWIGWGSNNISLSRMDITDVGGAGITGGAYISYNDNYAHNSDNGYIGTRIFGPSTPSFNLGGSAANKDLTGNSDCCVSLTNSKIRDVGRVYLGSACIAGPVWQRWTVQNNLISDCPIGGIQMSSISAAQSTTPGFLAGTYPGILIEVSYGSNIQNNIIQYGGYGFALDGTRVPGAPMAGDFGLFYIQGPQDGPADGSQQPLMVSGNIVHNVSGSCYSSVKAGGTVTTEPLDSVLDYWDGNSTNGVVQTNNIYYNSAAVDGRTPCPNRLTQHTGDLRTTHQNNIWAGTFPAGLTVSTGYLARADTGPYPYYPFRSNAYTCSAGSPCYTINANNLYKATASGTSGSSSATAPSCGSGACSADGTMTWTFQQTMPVVNYANEQQNITWWSLTGAASADPIQRGWVAAYPQFISPNNNMYTMSGKTITNYSSWTASLTWAAWQALGKDSASLVNSDPNFVDATGASGWQGFKFKATGTGSACGGTGGISPACGLGFVPYDFASAGPNW